GCRLYAEPPGCDLPSPCSGRRSDALPPGFAAPRVRTGRKRARGRAPKSVSTRLCRTLSRGRSPAPAVSDRTSGFRRITRPSQPRRKPLHLLEESARIHSKRSAWSPWDLKDARRRADKLGRHALIGI